MLVELATAMIIVTGIVSVLQSVEVYAKLSGEGSGAADLAGLSVLIGVASVVVGVLLRYGRAWLVGVNLLAIAGFLGLISATPVGFLFGLLDVFVVIVLMVNRPWFAWTPDGPGGTINP